MKNSSLNDTYGIIHSIRSDNSTKKDWRDLASQDQINVDDSISNCLNPANDSIYQLKELIRSNVRQIKKTKDNNWNNKSLPITSKKTEKEKLMEYYNSN